ncbi:MAG: N-formylglutamate amidohydrolase [Alphaproteobacteria bacterium]
MADFDPVVSVTGTLASPFVFASPHSGSTYPQGFVDASRLDPVTLRQSEDAFVDGLFAATPAYGAPLLKAHFPRAFLDVNREPWELDPVMFADPLPPWCNTRSLKVAAGLGTLARVIRDGTDIYGGPLTLAEAEHRISTLYVPYHRALQDLLDRAHFDFGCAVLIDCHSMPSVGGPLDQDRGFNRCDFVLGDRYGTACSPILTRIAAETLRSMGYRVGRNAPYAGGFCTSHYGAPALGRHALQIEVNRALYMNETKVRPGRGFGALASDLTRLVARLTSIRPDILRNP